MKYVLSIYADESGWDDATPEQIRASLKEWNALEDDMRSAGAHIAGEPLQHSATATVTDGPFAETKEQLAGFYLLDCGDLDEALGWAKRLPMRPGAKIEVRPVMDYSAFEGQDSAAVAEATS